MRPGWALILLFLIAGTLPAQEGARHIGTTSRELPACDAATLLPTDTSRARVVLVPPLSIKPKGKAAQLAFAAARLLAASFVAPTDVPLPGWTGTAYTDSTPSRRPEGRIHSHLLSATFQITVDPLGRVQDAKWLRRSAAPVLDAALLSAARRADSNNAFAALPFGGKKTRVIELSLGTTDADDSLGVEFLRLRLPFRPLTRPVRLRHIPPPQYPEAGYAHRIEERVELQYVVGADGRVVPGSVGLVNEPYQEFVDAAHAAILRGEFEPARIGECTAPQWVQQVISFRVRP